IGFAEAGPPRPLPSAWWNRVSGDVVSLAENPLLAPRPVRRGFKRKRSNALTNGSGNLRANSRAKFMENMAALAGQPPSPPARDRRQNLLLARGLTCLRAGL